MLSVCSPLTVLLSSVLTLLSILRQQQAVYQCEKEIDVLCSTLSASLVTTAASQHLATRNQLHQQRMFELSELMRRESDCLHAERERVRLRRRELPPRVRGMQAKLELQQQIVQAMEKERRLVEERRDVLRETEELLGLRRRKLMLQLNGIFPVIPLHSKKDKEREKERERKEKKKSRYSLPKLRPAAAAAATASSSLAPPDRAASPASPGVSPSAAAAAQPSSLSLTSHIPPARYYKLIDSVLPPFTQLLSFDEEKVSTALGYASLVLLLTSKYYALPLRYRLSFLCSRSVIWDETEGEGGGEYPLYGRGVESVRFEYGVYFLNQNLEHVLNERVEGWGRHVMQHSNTLEKLKVLVEGLMGLLL